MPPDRWHADLPFRGTRTYVQSASICNHLRQRFGPVSRFDLVMREWMAARLVFAPLDEVPAAKATLRIDRTDGLARVYGIVDDPTHPVAAREPYDEDGLVAGAPLSDRVITAAVNRDGTFFDRLISANKAVINRTLDPGVKLIATSINLDRFPSDDCEFQVRLDSSLGTRLFRSSVLIDGSKIGSLVYYGQ